MYGPNEPVAPERRRSLLAFAANFTHTLALLLWFAAGLAFAAGIPALGAAIVAVVAINGVFAFAQEHHAAQVVAGLMRRVAVQARVVRDGRDQRVPATELVPGDLVRLAAGDLVPADLVLLAADNLTLDLSLLTGETLPEERHAGVVAASESARALDLACVAPAGAAVIIGTAEGAVYATGPASTLGTIATLVQGVERGPSVLERQIATLSRVTAVIAILAGAATLSLIALTGGRSFVAALTFATGVIVALVPEGLLPTLSVSLAIGAERMAERGAAVRRLAAVEIVGSVTTICTDKTGTLTLNALSVLGFVAPDGLSTVPETAVLAAALCNGARPTPEGFDGDPIDVALARWVTEQGGDVAALRRAYPRQRDVPFAAERRYMAVTCIGRRRRAHVRQGSAGSGARPRRAGARPGCDRRERCADGDGAGRARPAVGGRARRSRADHPRPRPPPRPATPGGAGRDRGLPPGRGTGGHADWRPPGDGAGARGGDRPSGLKVCLSSRAPTSTA